MKFSNRYSGGSSSTDSEHSAHSTYITLNNINNLKNFNKLNKNNIQKIYTLKDEYSTLNISKYILNSLLMYLNYKVDNDTSSIDSEVQIKLDNIDMSGTNNCTSDIILNNYLEGFCNTNLLEEYINNGNDIENLTVSVPLESYVKRIYYLKN